MYPPAPSLVSTVYSWSPNIAPLTRNFLQLIIPHCLFFQPFMECCSFFLLNDHKPLFMHGHSALILGPPNSISLLRLSFSLMFVIDVALRTLSGMGSPLVPLCSGFLLALMVLFLLQLILFARNSPPAAFPFLLLFPLYGIPFSC